MTHHHRSVVGGVEAGARPDLLTVIDFLEGASSPHWGISGVSDWLTDHVVARACMPPLTEIHEEPVGRVVLHSSAASSAIVDARLRRLVTATRTRVVAALRGLRSVPPDDRFLSAMIFSGHVRRTSSFGQSSWMARPARGAPLSTIVLSFLAVDVLSHREQYDRELNVCDICGRMWFNPDALTSRCGEHTADSVVPAKGNSGADSGGAGGDAGSGSLSFDP